MSIASLVAVAVGISVMSPTNVTGIDTKLYDQPVYHSTSRILVHEVSDDFKTIESKLTLAGGIFQSGMAEYGSDKWLDFVRLAKNFYREAEQLLDTQSAENSSRILYNPGYRKIFTASKASAYMGLGSTSLVLARYYMEKRQEIDELRHITLAIKYLVLGQDWSSTKIENLASTIQNSEDRRRYLLDKHSISI